MDQIRIGTDIKLKITLEDLFGITDRMNIKRAKCFIINKTMLEQKGCSDCNTAYTLHSCAVPRYYGFPHYHYKSHWHILPYNGFGIYPDWHHVWHRYNFMHHPCCDTCEYELQVPVKFTNLDDVVIVDFPAFKLKHLGVYKLTFVFDVYVKGYNEFNVKTVTVDYDDAFELIASDDYNNHVTVEIVDSEDEGGDSEDYSTDNYVTRGEFDYESDGTDNTPKMTLDMNNGEKVVVDMSDLAWGYPDKGTIREGNPDGDID